MAILILKLIRGFADRVIHKGSSQVGEEGLAYLVKFI